MKGSTELGKRIREVRGGMTQVRFAELVGINVNTLRGYETGNRMPGTDVIARMAAAGNTPLEWLITGQEQHKGEIIAVKTAAGQPNTILPRPPVWEVPLLGFAECGLKGWYAPGVIPLRVAAPVDYPYTTGLMAVVTFGRSMEPDGIREGNILYCDPSREPDAKDAVYIARKDGKASIKQFLSRNEKTVRVKGWLDPDEHGNYPSYIEEIAISEIVTLAPVVQIKRKG